MSDESTPIYLPISLETIQDLIHQLESSVVYLAPNRAASIQNRDLQVKLKDLLSEDGSPFTLGDDSAEVLVAKLLKANPEVMKSYSQYINNPSVQAQSEEQAEDLTVVKFIGDASQAKLREAGISSIRAISLATSEQLEEVLGVARERADEIIASAKSLVPQEKPKIEL